MHQICSKNNNIGETRAKSTKKTNRISNTFFRKSQLKRGKEQHSTDTKYLGLIFDKKLTWASHILSAKGRCLRDLNILKVLTNTSWGADRHIMLSAVQDPGSAKTNVWLTSLCLSGCMSP